MREVTERPAAAGTGAPVVFSVVMPTHDRAGLVGRAIRSVLAQDHDRFELVVVDDGSPGDATAEVVHSFADPRIVYLRHERNRGVSAARNAGIAGSRGEWIVFLDDDDELLPHGLRTIAGFLTQVPDELAFTWGGIERASSREVVASRRSRPASPPIPTSHLGAGTGFALTVRRDAIEAIGGFDESLFAGVDFDFLIRLGQRYMGAPVPEVLVRVHLHSGGRLTDPSPRKVAAFERIADKHREFLAARPTAALSFWSKAAKIAYRAGRPGTGRRMALRVLRRQPFSWRRWKTMLCLELFGTEDLDLRRRLRLRALRTEADDSPAAAPTTADE